MPTKKKTPKQAPVPAPAIEAPAVVPEKPKTANAILNHGRWVVPCPDHPDIKGHARLVDPETDTVFVCGVCFPDTQAIAFKMGPDELFRPVPDTTKRMAAFQEAAASGRAYPIVYPDNPRQIVEMLRQRPVQNMNWHPGESLELLASENREHAVDANGPQISIVKAGK
jgi:hypothetical protein